MGSSTSSHDSQIDQYDLERKWRIEYYNSMWLCYQGRGAYKVTHTTTTTPSPSPSSTTST